MTREDYAALPLRERKKALTRRAIADAAERLFAERGFDGVTVAEIADAANVSVKTLFVYFRAKEDLVFADTRLIDGLLAAMRARPAGTRHADAVVEALLAAARRAEAAGGSGVEGLPGGAGESEALRSGLLRMWAECEDRVTAFLAEEAGVPANPRMRLRAIQLVGLVRTVASPELSSHLAESSPGEAVVALERWLRTASRMIR